MPETATRKNGKGNGGGDAPGPGHNSKDPQFTELDVGYFVREQKDLDDEFEELRKRQKALNRNIKKSGITVGLFKEQYKSLRMSDLAIEKRERERIKLAKFMGMPVGTQMGFWDDRPDEFAQAAPENQTEEASPAYTRGRATAIMGGAEQASPYDFASKEHQVFMRGYAQGLKEVREHKAAQAKKGEAAGANA